MKKNTKKNLSILIDITLAVTIALGALHVGFAFHKAFNGWNSPFGAVDMAIRGEK